MNSLMNNLIGGNGNIMMQAFGAMMSGKSPQQFLQSLPQLQGMNLSNLEQTARDLCASKGIDMEQKMQELKNGFANQVK